MTLHAVRLIVRFLDRISNKTTPRKWRTDNSPYLPECSSWQFL